MRKLQLFIVRAALAAALLLVSEPCWATTLPFSAHGTGPFAVYPLSGTLLEEDQSLAFDSFTPFPLTSGVYQDNIDLILLNTVGFPDALVFSTFTLSDGLGNSLFGKYTLDTSNFTDPIDPFSGDFDGHQDFGGTYTITGGLGEYLGATGGGTYTASADFFASALADHPGAILAGTGEYTATGTVSVPEPASWIGMILGLSALAFLRRIVDRTQTR